MARPALAMVSSGSAPDPIWLWHSHNSTAKSPPSTSATWGSTRRACNSISSLDRVSIRNVGRRSASRAGVPIEFKSGFNGGEPDLVDPKGTLHRIAIDRLDQLTLADNEARLRPTEYFVTGKRHKDPRRPPPAEPSAPPAARIARGRSRCPTRDRERAEPPLLGGRKKASSDLGGEALNAVPRRVDFEDQPRPFVQRRKIILLMGAIGRTDLDPGFAAEAMISGMRNAPPISMSSPRDTITSRPFASVFNTSSTAAALLLTIVASSAPVRSHKDP